MNAWLLLATELELPDFSSLYKPEMAIMPAAPYVKLLKVKVYVGDCALRVPFCQLSDGDLAVVAADPARTQRYTELVTHSVTPALRRIVQTVATQVRCGRDFNMRCMGQCITARPFAEAPVRLFHDRRAQRGAAGHGWHSHCIGDRSLFEMALHTKRMGV